MKGDRDACFTHLNRAEELARDAPASPAKARVLSQVARFRGLAGEPRLDEALEALALAERLDLAEIRAHALITIGTIRERSGDPSGRLDIERGLEIALGQSRLPVAIRAYSALASSADLEGDLREARRCTAEAAKVAERLGGSASIRWALGNAIAGMLEAGEWDRAVEKSDAFLAESQLAPHYHDCYVLASRSVIRLARGDLEGALVDQSAAMNRAREIEDPQAVFPALGVSAYVLAEVGRTEAACGAFAELTEAGPQAVIYGIEEGIWAADILGRSNEFAALLSGSDKTRRMRASRAVLEAEFDTAAEIFSEMGALLSAALARLRAAEQLVEAGRRAEADVQLLQALAFFRSVGATRYVRKGEALLAASA
jgi:hypothetical protein